MLLPPQKNIEDVSGVFTTRTVESHLQGACSFLRQTPFLSGSQFKQPLPTDTIAWAEQEDCFGANLLSLLRVN